MINSGKIKSIFYTFIFAYIIIAAAALYVSPVKLFWDPSLSLKMTDNWLKHIPFNNYQHPNTQNLNQDENEFVTWWSPGQFVLPMMIEKGFHIKLSIAVKILTAICLILSAISIFKLYNKLLADSDIESNSTTITLMAFVFTLIQPFFWNNLFTYEGGGILMLAYCPWFLYWVIDKRINALNIFSLLVLSLIGFFLKSAFTGIFLGALLYLFITTIASETNGFTQKPDIKKTVINTLSLGLVLIVYLLILKVSFLNHNRNISDSALGLRFQVRAIVYPIIAPVFKIIALDGLNKTVYWLAGLVLAIPFYYVLLKSPAISTRYKYAVIGFTGATFIFYWALYLVQVDVSYELRHFVIITLLLTPAAFILINCKYKFKPLLITFIFLYSCFSLLCFGSEFLKALKDKSASGYSGLALNCPQNLINKIHELDSLNKHYGKDIFCFDGFEPCIALEVINNRVLLKDNFINTHFINPGLIKTVYSGRNSGDLYIILSPQIDSANGLIRFEHYKHFEKVYQNKGYSIFKSASVK